jgi:hypothetical protein
MRARFKSTLLATGLALSLGVQACPKTADRSLTGPGVGESMVVNGLPVQIQQVSSRDDMKTVIERVKQAWSEAGYAVKTRELAQWQIVSALSDQCLTTLQLTQSNGTVGFLAISEPAKAKDRAVVLKHLDVPLPSGAHVVSSLSAKDGPRSSTTTMITSQRSVTDLRDHFAEGLREAGYGNVCMQEIQRRGAIEKAQMVSAQRGGEIVEVVIFDHQGTAAVINQGQAL